MLMLVLFFSVLLVAIICNVIFAVMEGGLVVPYLFYSLFLVAIAALLYRPWMFLG